MTIPSCCGSVDVAPRKVCPWANFARPKRRLLTELLVVNHLLHLRLSRFDDGPDNGAIPAGIVVLINCHGVELAFSFPRKNLCPRLLPDAHRKHISLAQSGPLDLRGNGASHRSI